MTRITYISGGERSGKSGFAQNLALQKSEHPIYIATARHIDENFSQRINRHQNDRTDNWKLIEEDLEIGQLNLDGKVVVIDCVTLWLSNIFFDHFEDVETSLEFAKKQWTKLLNSNADILVISNEIGMGVHGQSATTRKFVELQGWMNQHIAQNAQEAWLMVSGLPLKIK